MKPPRRLSADEAAIWRKVAQTVTPLERRRAAVVSVPVAPAEAQPVEAAEKPKGGRVPPPLIPPTRPAAPRSVAEKAGLDASWERKIVRGGLEPDFSLDLHGSTLDQAYGRLMHGLMQARTMGARVVLIVTGKPRQTEAADRGSARGAIRAKIVDWLGASEHSGSIAAVRGAHRRHGGQGALYVVLKRRR